MGKDIKVIVAAHKKYEMPKDKMYVPVQVGAEGKKDIPKIIQVITYHLRILCIASLLVCIGRGRILMLIILVLHIIEDTSKERRSQTI